MQLVSTSPAIDAPAASSINRLFGLLPRIELPFFIILLLAHLIPVGTGSYFPTADGPTHLYNADLLKNLVTGDSLANQFHLINTRLDPNWFAHILLAGMLFFLSAGVAEKVILCLYLIAFPLAFRFVIMQLNRRAAFLSLLAFPFLYNYVFQFGFYNYCLSLVFLFLIIGYWLRINYRFTQVNTVVLMTLITLVYITHPLSYLFSGLVSGTLVLERFGIFRKPEWKLLLINLLKLGLIYLPTGLLMLYYIWSHSDQQDLTLNHAISLYLYKLLTLDAIRFMGQTEKFFVLLVAGLLAWGGFQAVRQLFRERLQHSAPLLIVLAVTLVLYLVIPNALAGEEYIKPRLALTCYLFLILFFTTANWPVTVRSIFMIGTLLVAGGFLAYRTTEYRKAQAGAEEILTARNYIKPHSVMLPIKFDAPEQMPYGQRVSFRRELHPFNSIVNYLPIGKDVISLSNYEARTFSFPLLWQYNRIPDFGKLDRLEEYVSSQVMSIEHYENTIKQSVDYVVILGLDSLSHPIYQRSLGQELNTYYKSVYTSPNRLVRVYEKVE